GIAACGSGASPQSSSSSSLAAAKQSGGTITYALPEDTTPNYIFPFVPITAASDFNTTQFQDLMYRPLYPLGNNGDSVTLTLPLPTANAPVYTNGGKTVTITMK